MNKITFNELFDLTKLYKPPKKYETDLYNVDGLKSIFYEGVPYKGKETRIYAYIGFPSGMKKGQKVPCMVLVHGGLGTAYKDWVKMWNEKGYAAICMDLEGHVPSADKVPFSGHAFSGPCNSEMSDIMEPLKEQWYYHAISAVILARSLIETYEGIDKENIGITGISWGGFLTCLVLGIDFRYKCAIPIYGTGYTRESSLKFGDIYRSYNDEKKAIFLNYWSSEKRFSKINIPVLIINGDNDICFPVDITEKSAADIKNSTLIIKKDMLHSQSAGASPIEIFEFADKYLK